MCLPSYLPVLIFQGYWLPAGACSASMTMLPMTISGVWADFQRMMTVSQVCQMLSCSKGIGGWADWPALKDVRLEKVGWPSWGGGVSTLLSIDPFARDHVLPLAGPGSRS